MERFFNFLFKCVTVIYRFSFINFLFKNSVVIMKIVFLMASLPTSWLISVIHQICMSFRLVIKGINISDIYKNISVFFF